MKKKYFWVILLFLIFYIALELLLPQIAENRIENVIIDNTEAVQGLEVQVSSFPAWDLLLSRADRVKIKAQTIDINDALRLQSVVANYENVLLHDGKIMGNNSDLNILITEEALNDYIEKKYPALNNFSVKFETDQVFLEGFLKFFDAEIELKLSGSFTVEEESKIFFVPGDLQVEKLEIPSNIIKNFEKNLKFYFDPSQFAIPLSVEDVKLSSGKLLLLTGIYARKAGL